MRRLLELAIAILAGVGILSAVLAENALHVPHGPHADPLTARYLAKATHSSWEPAEVTAKDGAVLRGWLFHPTRPNHGAVLVLHGVGDSREGMSAQAQFLLDAGYTVLLPDSRGHGESRGSIISYGILEARDVRLWNDWLLARTPDARLFGLGASMGASVLLESLAIEHRFRAVVADCPFATFHEIALDRVHQHTGLPEFALEPMVGLGFVYADIRYGLDLRRASPEDAIRATRVPVLLIHGTADSNIPIRHSREIHALNPATRLWEVPGATHVASFAAEPGAYRQHVLDWFAQASPP